MAKVQVYYSAELTEYHFGPTHPMAPARLTLTMDLIEALGLLDLEAICVLAPPIATDAELARVHAGEYIAAIKAASTGELPSGGEVFGLADPDCPPFRHMHRAAARLAGASLAACRAVASGEAKRAINFAGGMHHAMPAKAAGFCVYNDAAVGIADLLAHGASSVLYIDIDAHHGDGVEKMFRDDPRVTTISIHQHPDSLFPHTGYPQDVGGTNAKGHAINLCLPPRSDDAAALRAIEAIVEPVIAELKPDVVITQHGCDAHIADPLTDLAWSVDGMRSAAILLRDLIETHSSGRWVALGGGGYAVCSVPPRAWSHLVAVAADHDLAPTVAIPECWRAAAQKSGPCAGADIPTTMGDGIDVNVKPFSWGYDPADPIDRAIMATRSAAFPELGIDSLVI
ncbi:hypothetical protein BSZ39_06715 [Bowdeniella nasicola]|uniref:Acetoin utilization protein AcuC n=1 Tax=Bowdeniella nasicola TaxID=208480 RepID=A0A1Q5Q243_9ACTO|nr:acetoin utilization protein AcuC [Bowdeniella nasicola]OKL53934.1 hypothetical protein BSZ39_06715 [Bowdeniella nasicola]